MEVVRQTLLEQIDLLEELLLEGNRIPFSGGRLVNEQEAIDVMDSIRELIPKELVDASQIISSSKQILNQSKQRAEEMIQEATQQRGNILDKFSIRQEAERQVDEIKIQARAQCEQKLQSARQQSARIEQEMQTNLAHLEQKYSSRRQQLEQEAIDRRQNLEVEALELKRRLAEQHEINFKQLIQELENVRQECSLLKNEAQQEAERIHNDALQFRHQTQLNCEKLIQQSRNESLCIQEGANNHAEKTLMELGVRLHEMTKVVNGGLNELDRIKTSSKSIKSKNSDTITDKTIPLHKYLRKSQTLAN